MDINTARARIHAMLTGNETTEQELDARLDDLITATATQPAPVQAGARVEIIAVQPYEITWDDNGDWCIGEYGVLLHISESAQAENARTGTHECAPYKVRLDSGETVHATDVRTETDGLRRTITDLDKVAQARQQRITDLETRVAELEHKKQLEDRERVELLTGLERALTPFCEDPKAAATAAAEVRHYDAEWLLRDAQLVQNRLTKLEKQREALTVRLRAGQTWQQGRNPALVSQDFISQDELRAIFGIPLVAPWDETP